MLTIKGMYVYDIIQFTHLIHIEQSGRVLVTITYLVHNLPVLLFFPLLPCLVTSDLSTGTIDKTIFAFNIHEYENKLPHSEFYNSRV